MIDLVDESLGTSTIAVYVSAYKPVISIEPRYRSRSFQNIQGRRAILLFTLLRISKPFRAIIPCLECIKSMFVTNDSYYYEL